MSKTMCAAQSKGAPSLLAHDPIILIVGPTASGKSDFAQDLAESMGGEVVNVDSQQFYRGLDIGTGKLAPEKRRVPHWLLDICEPGEWMSAMDFVRRAEILLLEIVRRGKVPILVGGTGFYVRALLEGLDDLPPRNPQIRKQLEAEAEHEGWQALYQRLQQVDPLSAAKIGPQDSARLIRYLEIFLLSGQTPSQLFQKQKGEPLRYVTHTYWLRPCREVLRERIALRVRSMIELGWLEEIRQFLLGGESPLQWSAKPIGYRELTRVLTEGLPLEQAIEEIIQKTRQYAKRQETFFKGLFSNPAYQNDGSILNVLSPSDFPFFKRENAR